MIQRRVVVPAGVDQLWHALTDPEEASQWLGGQLDWQPEEGGTLTFAPAGSESGRGEGRREGPVEAQGEGRREGRIEEVVPGRYLRFVWWPVEGGSDGASEVTYSLEPVIQGGGADPSGTSEGSETTILTVEEAPAPAVASPVACAVTPPVCSWSARDDAEWQMYAARLLVGAVAG